MAAAHKDATVVLTTKNRRDDLRSALESVTEQRDAAIETIVIDDGSTDGTGEMIRSQFPQVRLERRDVSAGYIVRRNEAARLATAPIIFSIDDDAAFSSPSTVAQTLGEFDAARVGAVAIPFINVNQDDVVRQRAPDDGRLYEMFSYIGTAHAVRRDLFNQLGGYREFFFHQNEEMDFCIRLMDAGYVVRVGRADPIHHFESPKRVRSRMTIYGRRNDILFTMLNVPAIDLPVHLAGTSYKGLAAGIRQGHPVWAIQGLLRGYGAALSRLSLRRPVSRATYKRFRALKRAPMLPVLSMKPGLADRARPGSLPVGDGTR
jgi:glycosyltransferase involved in cell wall biosynthesis